jgi:vancomycin resistance protein VanJ
MNFRKKVLNPLFFVLNSLVVFGFVLALLAPYIPPTSMSIFAFAATGFPLLLLLNVLFLIWWLVQLDKRIILPVLCLLIGFTALQKTYRYGRAYQEIRDEEKLSVMTYNVRSFNRYEWLDDPDIPAKVIGLIRKEDPDIILFQEYHHNKSFELPDYTYRLFGDDNNGNKAGLAIYSKIKLTDTRILKLDADNKGSNLLSAVINWKGKQINVFNVHLASVGLEQPDYETLENPDYEQSENLRSGLKKIAVRLHHAYKRRVEQSKKLETYLENPEGLVILGGDFNDVPLSYPYNNIENYLLDSFVEGGGGGFGSSYVKGPFPLRIDYLWHSDGLLSKNYRVKRKELSDHFPVIVDFIPGTSP